MEVTSQVANLQDEVKLLKGEIKAILKEIRTAVLSQDNPFSVGLDAMPASSGRGGKDPAQPQVIQQAAPTIAPAAQAAPASQPTPAPQAMPAPQATVPQVSSPQPAVVITGGAPQGPAWAGPVPASQQPPAPFMPAPMPATPAPPAIEPEGGAAVAAHAASASGAQSEQALAHSPQRAAVADAPGHEQGEDEEKPVNEPIPIRPLNQQDERSPDEGAPARERPSWSLPAIAGLAVWAEDALATLGPRRFQFVLELATFAELLSTDAQEVLSGLIDADTLSHEDERPLNVNECLVVLRQLEAIVNGEKVVKLPRRRGIRHRRIR